MVVKASMFHQLKSTSNVHWFARKNDEQSHCSSPSIPRTILYTPRWAHHGIKWYKSIWLYLLKKICNLWYYTIILGLYNNNNLWYYTIVLVWLLKNKNNNPEFSPCFSRCKSQAPPRLHHHEQGPTAMLHLVINLVKHCDFIRFRIDLMAFNEI